MNKRFALLLILILTASSLIIINPAHSSITKPAVPQFTVQLVDNSYDVPTTHSIDPYTGEDITHPGHHVENRSIEVRIKNQPFTRYWILDADGYNWSVNLFYNICVKGHFAENWNNVYSLSDGLPTQDLGEYTIMSLPADFPAGAQVDFKVEAMAGYIHRPIDPSSGWPIWRFDGETSGWSNTQTLTINGSAPITTPDDGTASEGGTHEGTTSDEEPQQFDQSTVILGVAITGIAVGTGVALLVYFKKRKR